MSNALEIDGKVLHSIKDAAQLVSYSRDYVTRLAREEKIVAQLVGRQWFVDVDSLKTYAETSAVEQELRKKQLSEERKRERMIREASQEMNVLRVERSDASHAQAISVAALVLCLGLVTGWGAYSLLQFTTLDASPQNVAQVTDAQALKQVVENSTPTNKQESVSGKVPTFSSRDVQKLPVENGVLLLPNATGSQPADLFSDEVVVTQDETGTTRVRRIDAEGKTIGNDIPFVVVPIEDDRN